MFDRCTSEPRVGVATFGIMEFGFAVPCKWDLINGVRSSCMGGRACKREIEAREEADCDGRFWAVLQAFRSPALRFLHSRREDIGFEDLRLYPHCLFSVPHGAWALGPITVMGR
jgi:hypothetical protein